VSEVTQFASYGGALVKLNPVYSDNPEHENKKFWDSMPSGRIEMDIANPLAAEFFKLGEEYYIDFTRCENRKDGEEKLST